MPEVAPSPLLPTVTVTFWSARKVWALVSAFTVIVLAASFSAMLSGLAVRVMAPLSLSARVMLPSFTVSPVDVPCMEMDSSPSTTVSSVGFSVKVALPLLWPTGIVTSKPLTAA